MYEFVPSTYQPISPDVPVEEIAKHFQSPRPQTDGVGLRAVNRSEFTLVAPVVQPAGPAVFLERAEKACIEAPYWENRLGTVHDLRVALINDGQQILFCATYSDEFKPYVIDVIRFATPWIDYMFTDVAVGYPGLASDDAIAYIAKHQVQANVWYGGPNPQASPRDIAKSIAVATALDNLLDATQG
ncbi:hypothetical protein Q3V23_01540 [Streptomyces sp. VNUA116]|uniref:hypothetical protein n=1 Tax=Streptomyces sp. VNUA116 TaxID=3062449 RepID=UPI0026745ED3|nr:hypothetical protein [Streptomyces sp. VNUA116]WKU42853.1 hypothetical protein Q3V23_01540 [Streptomyces sp. VNUA116]